MLDAIGHIDPTAPVYHWKIHRCHALLREVMGEDLYKEVIVAAPKEDEGDFGWIVTRGNEVLHGVADFMVTNQPSSHLPSCFVLYCLAIDGRILWSTYELKHTQVSTSRLSASTIH